MTDRTLISKQELRRRAAAVRDALSPAEIEAKSRAIMERLFALPAFDRARTVAFFASFRSEVRTEPMMTGALAAGKQVAVPRVRPGRELRFFLVADLGCDLERGCLGIPEPCAHLPEAPPATMELIAVPGLAFDLRGYRIGYGAGYYDRALRRFTRACRVGLAFECQIVERVPEAPHDERVNCIVSESRTIECVP